MSDCKKDKNHGGHLCVLVAQAKIDEVKKLVKAPAHICFNCGRVADSEENLCNPMPLK